MADFPYQLMPDLTEYEFDALKDDIQERGVQVPIEVDEDGVLLDGHHRWRACVELGIDCPTIVRSGWTDLQKRTHARRQNIMRRHLNREQKRMVIADELRDNPHLSNNAIGKLLGVSDNTVHSVREKIGADSDQRIGLDGKKYGSKSKVRATNTHTHTLVFRSRDELLAFRRWLRELKKDSSAATFGDAVGEMLKSDEDDDGQT